MPQLISDRILYFGMVLTIKGVTMMLRRTKIIATLGPATDDEPAIERLIRAGIDLVRINFSHGTLADHQRRVRAVRKCAAALGREVGILGDLQGPKIRIARFQNGCIHLMPGQKFVLDATLAAAEGSQAAVGVDYKQLPADVDPGDFLLLDDGRIELQVDRVDDLRLFPCPPFTPPTIWTSKRLWP
jgi:pyruvate kinase